MVAASHCILTSFVFATRIVKWEKLGFRRRVLPSYSEEEFLMNSVLQYIFGIKIFVGYTIESSLCSYRTLKEHESTVKVT
jgi:hypothetical protein